MSYTAEQLSEREFALREAEANDAEERYFEARPVDDGAMHRRSFRAGFERAWFTRGRAHAAALEELAALREQLAIETSNGEYWAKAYAKWVKTDKAARRLIEVNEQLASLKAPVEVAGVIALCRRSLDRDVSTLTSEQALASQCLSALESLAAQLADTLEENARLSAAVAERDGHIRQMVEKAAANSLDGYRELGARCAAAELRAERAEAQLAQARAEIAALKERIKQIEREHKDAMRDVAAEASRAARFPDEPYGTY